MIQIFRRGQPIWIAVGVDISSNSLEFSIGHGHGIRFRFRVLLLKVYFIKLIVISRIYKEKCRMTACKMNQLFAIYEQTIPGDLCLATSDVTVSERNFSLKIFFFAFW